MGVAQVQQLLCIKSYMVGSRAGWGVLHAPAMGAGLEADIFFCQPV
jgi:hypothetical protein